MQLAANVALLLFASLFSVPLGLALELANICSSPYHIRLRLPPSIDPNVDSHPPTWQEPRPGWLYGNWKITHSSNKKYLPLWNLQFDNDPTLPTCSSSSPTACPPGTFPGQNVDLQTWTAPKNSMPTIESVFGYDTPRRVANHSAGPGWNCVWDYRATGALVEETSSWELLAYGYDERGDGYIVAYETAASSGWWPAAIDIESRSGWGPSNGTYHAILSALRSLKNPQINAIVANMTQMVHNTFREQLPPFVCGPACVNNTFTPT